jgi:hypothetical protein
MVDDHDEGVGGGVGSGETSVSLSVYLSYLSIYLSISVVYLLYLNSLSLFADTCYSLVCQSKFDI